MIKVWNERGYDDFADGFFGNGGQNIYVSKRGILQRIFRFDLNGDGFADAVFVNSQDMNERPPVYVCSSVFQKAEIRELPTQGAYAAAVGDLNGDGYDDVVLANQNNGVHSDITAYIYYGSPDGLSERYKVELPAPNSTAAAIGDFNGDGKVDIAFCSNGKLRVFYQTEKGFLPRQYKDFDISISFMYSDDIDGDGYKDLYVRLQSGETAVFWGGPDGINADRYSTVDNKDRVVGEVQGSTPGWIIYNEGWRPKIIRINGVTYLFRAYEKEAALIPVEKGRKFGKPVIIDCENAVSAAAGDINGDGRDDLVVTVCSNRNNTETSWIYWGTDKGFSKENRTALSTTSARDAAVGDLDEDGYADIVICQGRTDAMNTTESLVFRGCKSGLVGEPVRFTTHDATCAFIARTCSKKEKQVIFVNHVTGGCCGDVPVYIYYGGEEGFKEDTRIELPGLSAPDAVCCDFDDDGWADIFVSNCSENAPHLDPGSFLYHGGSEGFSVKRKTVFPTTRAHGTAVGDFRHSGYLDLAVVGFYNPELLIFHGGPDGFDLKNPKKIIMDPSLKEYTPSKDVSWNNSGAAKEYSEPRFIMSADFNNDGWLDIFISQVYGENCLILWGGPGGFSMDRVSWLPAENSICAQAADLNGDGWLELIIGGHGCKSKNWYHDSYIYIYWGGPEGFRQDRCTYLPTHGSNSLAVADFNNDGILDIFTTSYNSGRDRDLDAYIYWGQEGGTFSEKEFTRLFTHSSSGCMALDFNEDGWIDLAVANHKTYGNHVGYSQIWWNGPEGFSQDRVTLLPTIGPHGMLAVDAGNIANRGMEEYYISSPHKLPEEAKVIKICWDAEIQKKTWIKAQIRFARTRDELSSSHWQGPDGQQGWFKNGQVAEELNQNGSWIQYRLALGAVNGGNSPRVREVSIYYEV